MLSECSENNVFFDEFVVLPACVCHLVLCLLLFKSKNVYDPYIAHISGLLDPTVLIEGVLFRARYLGSTQLVCEGQPTKSTRMMQAEEAVSRIKVSC